MKFSDKMKNSKITSKFPIWYCISGVIIVLALLLAFIYSLSGIGAMNLGIDFTGGTVMNVRLGEDLTNDNYSKVVSICEKELKDQKLSFTAPQKAGKEEEAAITFRFKNEINGKKVDEAKMDEVRKTLETNIDAKVREIVPTIDKDANIFTAETVGATQSSAIWLNALICVLVAVFLILIYVAIRFKLSSGISAVIALVHDVLIMVAFVTIFRQQINAPFIAALITIIGYSINNTIVIFDRIRENVERPSLAHLTPFEMADVSIKETFIRSINTTITTMLATLLLFILGVPAIREFTLPIIIGLVAGTYSSIFIAPSLWAIFRTNKINRSKSENVKQVEKKEKQTKKATN